MTDETNWAKRIQSFFAHNIAITLIIILVTAAGAIIPIINAIQSAVSQRAAEKRQRCLCAEALLKEEIASIQAICAAATGYAEISSVKAHINRFVNTENELKGYACYKKENTDNLNSELKICLNQKCFSMIERYQHDLSMVGEADPNLAGYDQKIVAFCKVYREFLEKTATGEEKDFLKLDKTIKTFQDKKNR
ncbi:MAG: hypothetical protein WCO44_02770 [Bacteroidota bacterium]